MDETYGLDGMQIQTMERTANRVATLPRWNAISISGNRTEAVLAENGQKPFCFGIHRTCGLMETLKPRRGTSTNEAF